MRNLQALWIAALLAGCGGPAWDYDAPNGGPSLAVGSGGEASGHSAASAGGEDATGGAGGEGGALPLVGVGQGGSVGQGGAGGQGGAPCEPEPSPCDGMPDGACGAWVDSCGAPVVCGNEACTGGILACHPGLGACVCQDAQGYQLAANTCAALGMGAGAARECGDNGPTGDIPAGCIETDVVAPDGHYVWCCAE